VKRISRRATRERRSAVEGADDAERVAIDDMGVDHRGPHVRVAEQRLNRPASGARFKQVGREAVARRVACRALGEPRRASGGVHGPLHCRLVKVIENLSPGRWIGAKSRCWEEVSPGEAGSRVCHLCAPSVGQANLAPASGKLLLVPLCHRIELGAPLVARASRKQCRPIMLSFSAADHDLPSIDVDIFDANRERFEESKAAPIEELVNEAKWRDKVLEQGKGVLPREDRREVRWPAGVFERFEPGDFQVEDPLVEEEERAERLVLRGCRGAASNPKLIAKGRDLFCAHLSWVLPAVELNELPDPVNVRLFGTRGTMQASDGGAYGFDEGHWDGPGCAWAVCLASIGSYRRGADASCGHRRTFRPGSGRPGHRTVGTSLAPRKAGGARDLATGIRAYAAAVYLRRWVYRPRRLAAYAREYGDRLRTVATYSREYGDRPRRLAAYMREYGDRPGAAADCDVRLCVSSSQLHAYH
jgi:hypothetical protein